jgi:hypothetical protein
MLGTVIYKVHLNISKRMVSDLDESKFCGDIFLGINIVYLRI